VTKQDSEGLRVAMRNSKDPQSRPELSSSLFTLCSLVRCINGVKTSWQCWQRQPDLGESWWRCATQNGPSS